MRRILCILLLCLLALLPTRSIQISDNVNINVGVNFVSKYVYRGACVSYENIQSHVKFNFGSDSTIGVFAIHPLFVIGHDVKKTFYYETDLSVGYTIPGRYLSVWCKYFNYTGSNNPNNENEIQVGIIGTLGNILPLSLSTETTVFNDVFLYDTNMVLTYDAIYKRWVFVPSIGVRFGCFKPYGYIQFDARRNIVLSDKVNMFVQLSGNINSVDIYHFTYQQNINGWLICGFIL